MDMPSLCVAASLVVVLAVISVPRDCVSDSGSGSGAVQIQDKDGDIRLVGGKDEREGRVEILLRGEWGTVCGDHWEDIDTTVVCKQLHFYQEGQMVLTVKNSAQVFAGESEGPVHMDSVWCRGEEPMLVNCSYTAEHSCSHNKDIGVVCPGNCSYGAVRLADGKDEYGGRVEVCSGGLWGTVCDDHWDISEARVVCIQLNIKPNGVVGIGGSYFGPGRDPILFQMDIKGCRGNENNLTECSYSTTHTCDHSEDVGVLCHGGKENCKNNDVRLVDVEKEWIGVVEVCANGVWGTICDDLDVPPDYLSEYGFYWEIAGLAQVICRQLGWLGPNKKAVILRGIYDLFNLAPRPILLQRGELSCNGSEDSLSDCIGYSIGKHSCSDTRGLFVQCPENCTDGDVRLVGGRNSKEGIVEVCTLGHWLIICHDRWTHREADVVCRQLNYLSPDSITVALSSHSFGYKGELALVHLVCSSNEDSVSECFSEIDYCETKDHAALICEVNCKDTETVMILDENNDNSCESPSTATNSHELRVILTSTLVPLLLIIAVLIGIIIIMLLRDKIKKSDQVLQISKYTNPLPNDETNSQGDVSSPERILTPQHLVKQQSPKKQQTDFPLIDLKYPEQSLPHYYESLRGHQVWLGSPSTGGSLEVLEEERGAAAANCTDTIGKSPQYAVLEPEEGVQCQFVGTADSLPSLLAPSSLDCDGGDSAVSSTAAVLNVETNPLPLPDKPSSEEPRSKKNNRVTENMASPTPESLVYDSLKPKNAVSKSLPRESRGKGARNTSPSEDKLTLSLKPSTKKSKDCQYDRLDSAP